MTAETQRLNEQRTYWQNKAHRQLDELFMSSLDQDHKGHTQLEQDLGTTQIIVWRLDQRLSTTKAEEQHNEAEF